MFSFSTIASQDRKRKIFISLSFYSDLDRPQNVDFYSLRTLIFYLVKAAALLACWSVSCPYKHSHSCSDFVISLNITHNLTTFDQSSILIKMIRNSFWNKSYLAILSLQDMVSSLSPWRTPSQVWMVLLERTGMVPSPDSILVRSCPRAFLLGCLSPWSESRKQARSHFEDYVHHCTIMLVDVFVWMDRWVSGPGESGLLTFNF